MTTKKKRREMTNNATTVYFIFFVFPSPSHFKYKYAVTIIDVIQTVVAYASRCPVSIIASIVPQ